MNRSLIIAKWEYLERVKTKSFFISLILTPLIIFVFTYLPGKLATKEKESTKVIGILDSTSVYTKPLIEKLKIFLLPNKQPRYVVINLMYRGKDFSENKKIAKQNLLNEKIDSYIFITQFNKDSLKVSYYSKGTVNFRDVNRIEKAFNEIRQDIELDKAGVDKSLKKILFANVDIKSFEIDKEGKESKSDFFAKFTSSLLLMILMMIMILGSGGMLIRSLVEEKSNRLIEILISSCRPTELLMGKMIGLSLLAITQVVIWLLMGISLMGDSLLIFTSIENLFLMMLYFIFGFIFYTSIFVGIGSVATTEQEAQQLTSYLSMLIMLPVAIIIPVMQNPDMGIVKAFTYIPFTMPAVMMLKISSENYSLIELLITIFILIISTLITIYLSAKIFKIGILSYGKRPSVKEIIQWIKTT